MFEAGLKRRETRLLADAKILAELPGIARAVEKGDRSALPQLVIPFGIQRQTDYVGILGEQGADDLFTTGRSEWRRLAVARGMADGGRLGLRQVGLGISTSGRPLMFVAVPVRARSGIAGAVLIGKALDAAVLDETAKPLGIGLEITASLLGTPGALAARSVDRLDPSRAYRYPLALSRQSRGSAELVVRVPTEQLDAATRSALLLAGVLGASIAAALTLLNAALLRHAVTRPLGQLKSAIQRVKRGDYDIQLDPGGARELREVAAGFTRMVGLVGEQRERLEALAATDPLTGLANHRRFHECLAVELERARRANTSVAVIALDIDHFKAVNDAHGHPYGDAVLRGVANRLGAMVRPGDVVARLGGEEFALLVPGLDGEAAYAMAERARAALAGGSADGHVVSCSAGVACFPSDADDGSSLVQLADGALYWAKRAGRGQTRRYDPAHVTVLQIEEQQQAVRDLIDCSEGVTSVFQPVVDLQTGELVGHEALARFVDPLRRPVNAWFDSAHHCGLGPALESRAIFAALCVDEWPGGTFLSLNVSPLALLTPEIDAVLPLDLSGLVIEITERRVPVEEGLFLRRVEAMRSRGALIALDDVGAGYAGLQQVMRIRPDIIKLDRSLVRGIDVDPAKQALIDSFARFASRTGALVCAEGMETLEELRMVRDLGVDWGQGYVLARPGPPWPDVSTHAREALAPAARA